MNTTPLDEVMVSCYCYNSKQPHNAPDRWEYTDYERPLPTDDEFIDWSGAYQELAEIKQRGLVEIGCTEFLTQLQHQGRSPR